MRSLAALAAAFLWIGAALADPTGSYNVVGINPDTGGEYTGTVDVTRTGNTYQVVWDIGGDSFIGTGLGALVRDGSFIIGKTDPDDTALSVGYISGSSFGMAMYFQQDDGSWNGVWTYAGSQVVAKETWTPR